jgi:hypothetical protein
MQPKLCKVPVTFNVNVGGFLSLIAEEKESESFDPQDGWHSALIFSRLLIQIAGQALLAS